MPPRRRVHGSKSLLPANKARLSAEHLLVWFRANARDLPWRQTGDPYAIWISEIMLQQTQVKTVIPYWKRWMRKLPNVQALAAAPYERVLKLWEGLGYYTRARNLKRAAEVIVASRAPFPRDFDAIIALPGVGRYTAGAICSIAFNQPKPVLDGNVIRVLTRLLGIHESVREGAIRERLWLLAEQLVLAASTLIDANANNCSHLNQAMMELGATLCTPRRPRCQECPLRRRCVAFRQKCHARIPNLGSRLVSTHRNVHAFVFRRAGWVLLRQRSADGVNASLWEFPNAEADSWPDAANVLGLQLNDADPVCRVRHSIMRDRITLHAWMPRTRPLALAANGGTWVKLTATRHLPFTAAHRKVLQCLGDILPDSAHRPRN